MKKAGWQSVSIFVLGIVLIVWGTLPFAKGWLINFFEQKEILYPLDLSIFLQKQAENPQIIDDFSSITWQQEPVIMSQLPDYGNLKNWFGKKDVAIADSSEESYLLNIPKLAISNAVVKVGGSEIKNNLVHFNPEVKVGGLGAPVIFGHSTLRQFYNPKESNKNRYQSIFSTIMTLQLGDEIHLNTGTITYVYQVTEKKEVQPDDDYILAQNLGERQVKLVTCVPEGTFLRRGVITATLQ